MAKKNVIPVVIETVSEFLVTGPNDTSGWVKVYRDYETKAEFSNAKNSGGEIWDWAQSNWPDFAEEEQEFEVGGGTIKGTLRWICVRGVKNSETGASLPIQDEYKRYNTKKAKQSKSASSGNRKQKPKVTAQDKKKAATPPPAEEDEFGGVFDGVDIEGAVSKKVKKALEEG